VNLRRRQLLWAAGAAAVLPGCASAPAAGVPAAATPVIDLHSHAGRVIVSRDPAIGANRPFLPVAEPMRDGGVDLICLAIVTDTTVTRVSADRRRFEPYRDPAAGELYALSQTEFARLDQLVQREKLNVVERAGDLDTLRARGPSVLVASEGADFLEGRIERVDEAFRLHRLRLLQLTHYHVSEVGDIQTEAPVHGGLSDFGAEVVKRCQSLGIVVDVAHGPYDLVKRVASIATRPLVLSHTSLTGRPGPRSRQIGLEHARLVAQTGGVIGVWPNAAIYPNLDAMAMGAKRLADAIGVDHVGLGTDMLGFISPPVLGSYRQVPAYAQALRVAGFTDDEVAKVLGGNALRVLHAGLPT